jgi:hypothetical protein
MRGGRNYVKLLHSALLLTYFFPRAYCSMHRQAYDPQVWELEPNG